RAVEADLIGKKGRVPALNRTLGQLPPEARKAAGAAINEGRATVEAWIDARRSELAAGERRARLAADRLDLTEVPRDPWARGHRTVVSATRERLEDVFVGMGFEVAEGPLVETDWHNFEALNIPLGHPARSRFDTLYFDVGEPESILLRPHTSPVQVRLMTSMPPPIYAVMPGPVYRKDTPDARHLPTFNQIEGLVVDRGITFGDLAGTIESFTQAFFGPDVTSRLRPASFPFTEPSAEYEITCPICRGAGCRTCSQTGWIELGGCGMVHPNVFRAVDIDPEEHSGFAFGFGIDRLAQTFHAIPDMRVLLDNDLRFTTQF
ncbi:MAG: phenylalanine--tRNA ligase subunit alpha, partial [Acidimicrobiales bacterium]